MLLKNNPASTHLALRDQTQSKNLSRYPFFCAAHKEIPLVSRVPIAALAGAWPDRPKVWRSPGSWAMFARRSQLFPTAKDWTG